MQKITFVMLNVEQGKEIPITIDSNQSVLFIACALKAFTDNGHILSEVIIKDEKEN